MTVDFGKQLYALAHGVSVQHVEESDAGLSAVRAALAAAPAEPVWPDDIGAVLRDLRDDLMAFRVQCRDDGEVLRAVGVGDALDMLAGRIAKHPRRSVSPDDAHTTSAGFTLDDQGRRVRDGWDHDGDLIATLQGELGGMQARWNRVADAARGVTLRNGMLVGIDALTEAVEAWDEGVDTDTAHTETATWYRIMGVRPDGTTRLLWGSSDSHSREEMDEVLDELREDFAGLSLRVESRTVTTSRRESEWKATDQ